MNYLRKHYAQLLGLGPDWSVDLSLDQRRVELRLVHQRGPLERPECGAPCHCADHAPERSWRHLDTMQFETILRARVPRTRCGKCGAKTIAIP